MREWSGTERNTTNNRMEPRAAIQGLKSFPSASNVVVVSDSRYLNLRNDRLAATLASPQLPIEQWPGNPEPESRQELIAASKRHNVRGNGFEGTPACPNRNLSTVWPLL